MLRTLLPVNLGVRRYKSKRPMSKPRDDSGLWTIHGFVELAVRIGLISGAAFSAPLGQLFLAAVLLALAAGIFLRFKRRSKK